VRARMSMYQENIFLALVHLVERNRRRYGGYIVHVGIVIYFVAFTGLAFQEKVAVDLSPGESAKVHSPFGYDYVLTARGVSQYVMLNRKVTAATLAVTRNGKRIGDIKSEKRQHMDSFGNDTFEPSTEVGIISDLREDLYVVYAGSIDGTERAHFTFLVNPLVPWFWIGGVILTLGGILAMWPGGPQVRTRRRRSAVQSGYSVPLAGVAE
jgi:cytochrome c-type biogenesis protein CcmF